ncbi:MAG TPA: FAD-binding protein [Candidatus Binatia bacterium]|nr:FAD-binding protein [Candidatus Binatia bacterium]
MVEAPLTRECDVLVVGAGGAGMRAAIAAAEAGCSTLVVSKSLLGKAHTVMAEGGIAAGLGNVDSGDGWDVHFADTMLGGQLINDWRMVDIYAREVIDRVYELERWGGLFDRTPDGRIMQRAFGAHSWKRLAHVGDRTGLELIRTCQDRMVHTPGVDVLMEYTLTRLLTGPTGVVGAMGYDRNSGELVVIRARAVVLGSGGWGRMYRYTSNSWEGTGDGAAMAYEAGAELQDMEFVQFHPTGMVWPPGARGILVTEGVRGEGGILRNSQGERFMERYDPVKKDLSSRDVVARSIYREVEEGRGSPHGGAFLDIATQLPAAVIRSKLPSMVDQFEALAGVDITREPMEVYPTIHYTMGGIRVDPETAASTVPGLYAAGECAAGLHGANRLGGNSLGDILVFGRRAGESAGELAKNRGPLAIVSDAQVREEAARLLRPLEAGGDQGAAENPYELHRALQAAMQDDAGIGRSEESLKRALAAIQELRERSPRIRVTGGRVLNPGWHTCRDVDFMLTVSEAIVRSALERRESRGSQWRFDYPKKDDRLGRVNLVALRRGGAMAIEERPVVPMPDEAVQRLARSRFFDPAALPPHYAGRAGDQAVPAEAH